MLKKQLMIAAVVLLALAAAGCNKEKPIETAPAAAPQAAAPGQDSASPSQPAAAGHKGKVVTTMDGGAYTFMEVEENGRKIWVGVKQTKINVGDVVEFPASPSVEKFKSKALNRTFDKVYFVTGFRVTGK